MVAGVSPPRPAAALLLLLGLLTPAFSVPACADPAAQAEPQAMEPESPGEPASFEARCRKEVEELHAFFQAWFNGSVDNSDETYARVTDVLGEGFLIISPSGNLKERDELVEALRRSYKPEGTEPIHIQIDSFRIRQRLDDVVVVTYVEWQQRGEDRRGRLTTAVLRQRAGTPNGFEWLHVHETWLPR